MSDIHTCMSRDSHTLSIKTNVLELGKSILISVSSRGQRRAPLKYHNLLILYNFNFLQHFSNCIRTYYMYEVIRGTGCVHNEFVKKKKSYIHLYAYV